MSGDCGHFIFEGQPGVGKKTMIWAMLREVFGPDNIQTHSKIRVFNLEVRIPLRTTFAHGSVLAIRYLDSVTDSDLFNLFLRL